MKMSFERVSALSKRASLAIGGFAVASCGALSLMESSKGRGTFETAVNVSRLTTEALHDVSSAPSGIVSLGMLAGGSVLLALGIRPASREQSPMSDIVTQGWPASDEHVYYPEVIDAEIIEDPQQESTNASAPVASAAALDLYL